METIKDFVNNPLSRSSDSLQYDIGQRNLDTRSQQLSDHHKTKLKYEQQLLNVHTEQESLQKDLDNTIAEHKELQKLMAWAHENDDNTSTQEVSMEDLNALIAAKEELIIHIDDLNKLVSHETWKKLETEYHLTNPDHSLVRFVWLLEQLMQIGKIVKAEQETVLAQQSTFQSKIENKSQQLEHTKQQLESHKQQLREQSQQKLEHEVSTVKQKVESTQRQIDSLLLQTSSLDESLALYQKQQNNKVNTQCTLDHEHCPSVDAMIKAWSDNLRLQIENNNKQKEILLKSLKTTETLLFEQNRELMEAQNLHGKSTKEKFVYTGEQYNKLVHQVSLLEVEGLTDQEKIESWVIEGKITKISNKLESVRNDYKKFSSLVSAQQLEDFTNSQAQLATLTNQIISTQSLIQKSQEQQLIRAENKSKIEQISKQMLILQEQLDKKYTLSDELKILLQDPLYTLLGSLEQWTKKLENLLSKAQDLLTEKIRIQDQSLKIKADVDKATLLHTIFGKELTLYVLKSYIPLLNEYINAFLAKVVSFQLNISVNEDGDELELIIEDEFGAREVKSLSGGQKTVLRLCWILATSVVFRNSFLLLDETINNLDEAIISNVAELLTDYVKKHNISFYTVTHSAQIQNMSIRDDTIEITAPMPISSV
jgi:DNA repair exonuclease SbcCD ATPase subunit